MSFLITTATALEQRVAETASGRGFDDAVAAFAGLLNSVSDLPPRTTGDDVVAALRALAERVIAHIERRLEGRADRLSRQVALAQEIYQIQQALENIDRSHRPHLPAAAPTYHGVSCPTVPRRSPVPPHPRRHGPDTDFHGDPNGTKSGGCLTAMLTTLNPRLSRVAKRICGEFREMPGMRLTAAQVQRLWSLSPQECEEALDYLCEVDRLAHDPSGCYLLSSVVREKDILNSHRS